MLTKNKILFPKQQKVFAGIKRSFGFQISQIETKIK